MTIDQAKKNMFAVLNKVNHGEAKTAIDQHSLIPKKAVTIFETINEGLKIQVMDFVTHRELHFGTEDIQSAYAMANPEHLYLAYTRCMMMGFVLHPRARNVLHIGLGGGSMVRFIHTFMPQVKQDVIESNSEVVEVAKHYFGLPKDQKKIRIFIANGIEALKSRIKHYDLIFLDAYNEENASEDLNSRTGLGLIKQHLKPNGWLIGNTINLTKQQLNDWRYTFFGFWQVNVPTGNNTILFGSNSEEATQTTF